MEEGLENMVYSLSFQKEKRKKKKDGVQFKKVCLFQVV